MTDTPVTLEDALSSLDAAVKTAVANTLRAIADSLDAPAPAKEEEPRFYLGRIAGTQGVFDTRRPTQWAMYLDAEDAADLNTGRITIDDAAWWDIPAGSNIVVQH